MIELRPYGRLHQKVVDDLLDGTPDGQFFLAKSAPIYVPHSRDGTDFELKVGTSGIGELYEIRITSNGEKPPGFEPKIAVIAPTSTSLVTIKLGRGLNRVRVSRTGESEEFLVASLNLGLVHEAVAKQVFKYLTLPNEDHQNAIANPMGARLVEWMLTFHELLPDVHSMKMLAIKLLMNAVLNNAGKGIGVRDFITGVTANTPVIVEMPVVSESEAEANYEPITNPVIAGPEKFAGVEVHVWLSNLCVLRWSVFVDVVNNIREVFQLTKVSEDEVILRFNNDFVVGEGFKLDKSDIQRHLFLYDGRECLYSEQAALTSDCFNVTAFGTRELVRTFVFCAANYSLDVVVERCYALGARYLDCGDLDSASELDAHDQEDPAGDGWVGFPLVSTTDACLDSDYGETAATPEDIQDCCTGFAVMPLMINYAESDAIVETLEAVHAQGIISDDPGSDFPLAGAILE